MPSPNVEGPSVKVVMVVKSGVTDDARIRRIAGSVAAAGHEVIVIGDRPGPDDDIPGVGVRFARAVRGRASLSPADPVRRFARWLLLPTYRRRDDRAFARAVTSVAPHDADVIHAHDLSGLRAAQRLLRNGTRLVYDSHECWTGQRLPGRPTPIARRIDLRDERRLGDGATRVITVSEPLARWLERQHGWGRVDVVRNTFPAIAAPSSAPAPRSICYAGRVDKERDLETIVDGARLHGGLGIVIRGNGDAGAIARLEAKGVDVKPARPVSELVADYHACGIGVVSLSGDSFNHQVALPNKLFHAVQAGVPVVASDLPAISNVVLKLGIGECFSPGDPDSFAAALERLLDSYGEKREAVLASQELLSWVADEKVLLGLYADLAAP